jgi:AcrR family transcriptional regulator
MVRQSERSANTIGMILAAGRRLFSQLGYDAVSIDMIAGDAGVAKGAVYHHFASKKLILEQLVDLVQAELAAQLAALQPVPRRPPSAASLAAIVGAYLRAAVANDKRRILLIDGPAVLGWELWRQIDDRHFAAMLRGGVAAIMGPASAPAEVDAATRLAMGAIMEAALACGAAQDAEQEADQFQAALERMLSGLASRSEQS